MKISVDIAALCNKLQEYGNHTVTRNIVEGIKRIDADNIYSLYSFCKKPQWLTLPENMLHKRILPRKLWLSTRVSLEEFLNTKDIFLALNQAVPFYTKARIFSFSHGLSYYFFKDLYPNSYEVLKDQLFTMMDKSQYVFVSSAKVKKEMTSVFLKTDKVKVLPYVIPYDMLTANVNSEYISSKVRQISKKLFLYVGMDHPVKNLQFLVDAFTIFSQNQAYKDYTLLLIGADFENLEIKTPNIQRLKQVNREEIKYLYQKASGYISASLYESFNFPVLEALSQNCPVVVRSSAIIPELSPYVHIADHVEEFVESMKRLAAGSSKIISKEKLKKEFSWDSYLTKLISYYKPA